MKKTRITALILLICTLTVCVFITPSSAEGVDNAQVQSIEQQIKDNAAKQAELDKKLNALSSDLSNAWDKKTVLDSYVETTSQQKASIEYLISQLEEELAELAETEIETNKRIESQRKAFLSRMAALHEDGNATYLELILGAEDLTTFLTKYDYVTSMLEYDKKLIADLKESKKDLEKTRAEKEADLATQKSAKENLAAEETRLNSLVAEQQAVIDQIASDKSTAQTLKNQALAEEAALDSKLTAMLLEIQRQEELAKQQLLQQQQQQQQQEQKPAAGTADGEYMWPIQGTGYISSSFGGRYLNGAYDYHGATDIACSTGTPIYASNGGTVVISEYHYSYGNYVLINHGNGYATLYAHMSVRGVSAGQSVAKGDVIGQVGNTGYSFGSHLHFEFRINGQRVDPVQYVPCPY